MFEFIFMIVMFWIFGKLLIFGIRAAWGISKIFVTVLLLPVVLVMMVLGGLMYVALPVLAIVGLIALCKAR